MIGYDAAPAATPVGRLFHDVRRRLDGERARMVAIAVLIAVCYYAGSRIGFLLTFPGLAPSVLWPPNAILTATLLLARPSRWPIYLLAAFPAHLAVQLRTRPARRPARADAHVVRDQLQRGHHRGHPRAAVRHRPLRLAEIGGSLHHRRRVGGAVPVLLPRRGSREGAARRRLLARLAHPILRERPHRAQPGFAAHLASVAYGCGPAAISVSRSRPPRCGSTAHRNLMGVRSSLAGFVVCRDAVVVLPLLLWRPCGSARRTARY